MEEINSIAGNGQAEASGTIVWLTPEGHEDLKKELEYLTLEKRPEIAERIRESQEHGEFSEDNSELDEVKFEQAIVESRIAELKSIFGTAQVLNEEDIPTSHVGIGSLVTLRDSELGENFTVRVVSSIEADPNKDYISNESPMGSALLGSKKGDTISVDAPDGPLSYEVTKIAR